MTSDDANADSLYQIAHEIREMGNKIVHEMKNIKAHLEDISAGIAEINKNTPNILDRE